MAQMRETFLVDLNTRKLPLTVGNKARNLRQLLDQGLLIPRTFVISWASYRRVLQEEHRGAAGYLRKELETRLNPQRYYSVRSSANIEDSPGYSFAGQFKSILNVLGIEDMLKAIQQIWESAHSGNVQKYQQRIVPSQDEAQMGIIIQEMVQPVFSGVSFSRNPVTGAEEVVVEAVRGSGELLLQNGVTPLCWISQSGRWKIHPEEGKSYDTLIHQIVETTLRVARQMNTDIDLEWVYDGNQLYWVQVREITTLRTINIYSNSISKEMIPGLIKPLIGSINIPMVSGAWIRLLSEIIGSMDFQPSDMVKPFYYRIYFNMGVLGKIFEQLGLPSDSVEMMMGVSRRDKGKMPLFKLTRRMLMALPKLPGFVFDKTNFNRRLDAALPKLEIGYREIANRVLTGLADEDLLAEVEKLYQMTQQTAFYNMVGPLLMNFYHSMLSSRLKRLGVEMTQFDLMEGISELAEYDPAPHLEALNASFNLLDSTQQDVIRRGDFEEFLRMPNTSEFQQQVIAFIERFGHFSDNGNDFSAVPWRENPNLMLKLIVSYRKAGGAGVKMICLKDLPLWGISRWSTNLWYRRARQFRLYRARISSLYTFGYGLFRRYYLELGNRLVHRGILENSDDIFYFERTVAEEMIRSPIPGDVYKKQSVRVHQEMEFYSNVELPPVIYGDEVPPIVSESQERLTGIPTSAGYYSGPVKVVCSTSDYEKMHIGDVLVVPYSDVGLSPLFAQAGAVVAESGGMLSHSSIVAREYNIPAVVSVPNATRLQDNAWVTVDGYKGEVIVHVQT
jgi:phosphohistidine swiveling domain-containing protein